MASVAHALAYCHAIERIAGVAVPWPAALVRVLHAELERLAGHLDVAMQAGRRRGPGRRHGPVGVHKERVLRLVSRMCGSRFGRGVVVPGGVSRACRGSAAADFLAEIGRLDRAISADVARTHGHVVVPGPAAAHGPAAAGAGPRAWRARPGRQASGFDDDAPPHPPVRRLPGAGPSADRRLTMPVTPLARLRVRWDEVRQSFHLLRQAADELAREARRMRPRGRRCARTARDRRPRGRLGRGPAGRGPVRPADRGRADHPLPAPVGVIPQPGAVPRSLRRGHPHRLPVHRGQLRPLVAGVAL